MPLPGPRPVALAALTVALSAPGVARAQDSEIEIEVEATPPPAPAAPPAAVPPAAAPPAAEAPPAAPAEGPAWLRAVDVKVSGYVQPQVVFSQLSEDEVTADGGPFNQDRFLIRRGRVAIERSFSHAYVGLELEANTVHGPTVNVHGAEVAVLLPHADQGRLPYARLSGGLSDIPFGYEVPQDSETRYFMERTLGSRAFFPGDSDVGAQLSGALGPVRYALAVQNGVPFEEGPDAETTVWTARKTIVGRVGVDVGSPDAIGFSGGVSYLGGTGFHAGTPATKSSLLWSDTNQDGLVTLNELVSVNGQAATASETFGRWGVNVDAQLAFVTPLGTTRLFGEATMATNLDRGYYVADPVATGHDVRELAWSVGATQEITRYGIVGFRADGYDPNSDFFEARRGQFVPTDISVLTLSPVVGVQLKGRARLLLQYDYVVDHLGRDDLAQPVDLPNDQWTLRGQVEF